MYTKRPRDSKRIQSIGAGCLYCFPASSSSLAPSPSFFNYRNMTNDDDICHSAGSLQFGNGFLSLYFGRMAVDEVERTPMTLKPHGPGRMFQHTPSLTAQSCQTGVTLVRCKLSCRQKPKEGRMGWRDFFTLGLDKISYGTERIDDPVQLRRNFVWSVIGLLVTAPWRLPITNVLYSWDSFVLSSLYCDSGRFFAHSFGRLS